MTGEEPRTGRRGGAERAPQHVAVVGAGMVGLATAWFLQERGVRTTVVDRTGVGAGASWGNAGLLNPAVTVPLPEPAALRAGIRGLFDSSSPVVVPPVMDLRRLRFMMRFALNSRPSRWRRSMQVFNELNRVCLSAYDHLAASGVSAPVRESAPMIAAAADAAGVAPLARELEKVAAHGGEACFELADGDELRALEPVLSDRVQAGLLLHGQRFIDPPAYLESLAEAVRRPGGEIREGFEVTEIHDLGRGSGVSMESSTGDELRADAAVLANGTWLSTLARAFGVRQPVQAGRGYSFSVEPERMPSRPVYLPAQRLACNPLNGRFRITGTMELQAPEVSLDRRRIVRMVDAARPLLSGVDWEARREEWVGSRPCTADGLPMVGRSRSPRVFVAGGHGMWGMVLGPATGELMADVITGRGAPPWLNHLDPLR